VKPLTQSPPRDRLLERRRQPQKLTARATLAASLIFGAIVGTGTSSPAQSSQPDYKQPPTPLTKSSQIDRRRICPVFLAASEPAGQRRFFQRLFSILFERMERDCAQQLGEQTAA